MSLDISPLVEWANEREAIRLRKEVLNAPLGLAQLSDAHHAAWGQEGDWTAQKLTNDSILRQYRFCNVQREHDRVTVWIEENIRKPFKDHPHLWFMLAAARYINWPETLKELMELSKSCGSWPDSPSFKPEYMTAVLEARRARGEKVETGAYMIRAESDKNAPWYNWSKQRYVAEVVLGKLWERRESFLAILDGKVDDAVKAFGGEGFQPTMEMVWGILQEKHYTGWGPFMAYQWVVDLRWTRYLRDAPDIQTWAAVGPGSRRGLNRLAGRPVDYPLKQDQALLEMLELRYELSQPGVLASWLTLPDLSDIQNCLCETDKYMRVKNGEGRPRSMYVPGRGY